MKIPFRLALGLSALSGFIALAHEILWTRVYNFVSGSSAQALGMMLGSYLLGLAAGAVVSRRWQDRTESREAGLRALGRLFILSNVAAFLVAPGVSWIVTRYEWPHTLPLVVVAAGLMGIGFPLLCHHAIAPDRESGARLSYIYLANIIGSGAGSLLTGFVLTEFFALWQISAGLLVASIAIAVALTRTAGRVVGADLLGWLACAALAVSSPWLYGNLYARLQYKKDYHQHPPFTEVLEGRHGVITVENGVTVYGNGMYDGMLETDPARGGGLFRPLFISAVHPAPREVLVIGMAGGAWTKLLAEHPGVSHVTVVEISSDYLNLIRRHPKVANVLTHPKVTIAIDDGRRWLRRHPDRRFDFIVMNTTYHWREYASALLGREFLELARSRLEPDGIVMWNCTGSGRAALTGVQVFPHTLLMGNSCIASNQPITIDAARWRTVLTEYRVDGRPLFDRDTPEGRAGLEEMVSIASSKDYLLTREEMIALYGREKIITDDNLGHEYKFTLADTDRLKRLLLPFAD